MHPAAAFLLLLCAKMILYKWCKRDFPVISCLSNSYETIVRPARGEIVDVPPIVGSLIDDMWAERIGGIHEF